MTTEEKKEYLSQYRQTSLKINSLIDEKRSIQDFICRMSPTLSDIPKEGNGQDKTQCGVEKMIELSRQIQLEIESLIKQRKKIETIIGSVDDEKQREVLRFRYINGFTWEKIALEMNLTYQWVCALHGKALKKINLSA